MGSGMTAPNLLSINSYHYRRGGSDVVYLEHEAMFREIGWNAAHMSMHHPKNIESSWSKYFVDELEFGHKYSALEKIKMASKVIFSFEARKKLSSLLDVFPASVAHLHCIYHHISPSVLPLLRDRGVPVVLTAHDLKIACPAYKMLNRNGICERCRDGTFLNVVANRCVRNSLSASIVVAAESILADKLSLYKNNVNRVVAPSLFYKNKLIEWGWPDQQIAHIPNYVRSEKYIPNFWPGNYFIYFGRLAPEKGVETLIRAAIRSSSNLMIVGSGPIENELKAIASGSSIEFLGFKSGDDLWNLVRQSRAVVLPSEWYENCPMSVLESYALGKPVIGANIGGIPEIIQSGVTGWIFESGNEAELSELLHVVTEESDSILEEMGRAARNYVAKEFTPEKYMSSTKNLYSSIGVSF